MQGGSNCELSSVSTSPAAAVELDAKVRVAAVAAMRLAGFVLAPARRRRRERVRMGVLARTAVPLSEGATHGCAHSAAPAISGTLLSSLLDAELACDLCPCSHLPALCLQAPMQLPSSVASMSQSAASTASLDLDQVLVKGAGRSTSGSERSSSAVAGSAAGDDVRSQHVAEVQALTERLRASEALAAQVGDVAMP